MEIAHREFAELRDVEDEHIHFAMVIKRLATGTRWSQPMQSRISPAIWEAFFNSMNLNADGATAVLFIEVDKPMKRGWGERLGLVKAKKVEAVKRQEAEPSEVGADLPTYTKAIA